MTLTATYLKPYWVRSLFYGAFVVLSVVFTIATALSVADFLKLLFEPVAAEPVVSTGNYLSQVLQSLYNWLIVYGPRRALLYFSLLVFLLYAFKNVFTYLAAVQISIIRTYLVRDVRDRLFQKAMHLPLSYYGANRKGDMLSRFSNDIVEYDENIMGSLQMLATAVISILLYLAMILYINAKLTLVVLVALPFVAFVISGISRRLKQQSKDLQERNSFLMSLIQETIEGLKIIKAYTAIPFSNERFQRYNADYNRRRTRMYRRIYLASPVSDTLGNIIVILILLFGSYLVFNNDAGLTPELFISYLMVFVLIIPPAKDLATAVSQIKKGRACADRLQEFLSLGDSAEMCTIAEKADVAAAESIDRQHGNPESKSADIEFSHVSFAYSEGHPVLHDISFLIPQGSTVALVGPSGSGKSTMADLLSRFYEPSAGQITLGGVPVSQINVHHYRRQIGVIAQDTLLFNDTVANNIAFVDGVGKMDPSAVEAAARLANAHEFIQALPLGYQTLIGDNGSLLSGGQRQRIAIARALYAMPPVLILDEATSALDTESEYQVQQAIGQASQGRTVLVIAHRLSTIQHANQILFLENGRIVEHGTHSQLMAQRGRYWQLVELQELKN